MDKISVIIVTYNRIKLLKECLQRLNDMQYIDNIYVINNNSNDGTKEYLNDCTFKAVKPVNLSENIGGAGGFSYGIRYAYENSDSAYFLIMDDDTMVENNTIDKLMDAAKKLDDNFGFLCSDVRWYKDGNPAYMNIPVTSIDWNTHTNDGLVKLKSASFVSFLTKRSVVKEVGLPISEMFIWADDVEYSTRISQNFPSYYVENSEVIHKCKSNSLDDSIVNCSVNRVPYYECMFRNRIYIYRHYYPIPFRFLYAVKYLTNVFSILLKSDGNKMKRIKSVICGVTKGFFFNPTIKFPRENK